MSNRIPIKTRAVGGFDKKQVDDYLDSLAAEYDNAVSKEDISKLRDEIAELKRVSREKDKKISELKEKLTELDKSNDKPDFDNLSNSAKKFIDAHNEVILIADKTSKYINSTERKLPCSKISQPFQKALTASTASFRKSQNSLTQLKLLRRLRLKLRQTNRINSIYSIRILTVK